MNEDFTEEEEFDELPAGVEFAEATEKKPLPASPPDAQRAPAPQQQKVETRGRPKKVAPAPTTPGAEEVPVERYVPYVTPKKVGVLDNEINQPLMEDENVNNLLLGLMTKLLNDIEDIKKNL